MQHVQTCLSRVPQKELQHNAMASSLANTQQQQRTDQARRTTLEQQPSILKADAADAKTAHARYKQDRDDSSAEQANQLSRATAQIDALQAQTKKLPCEKNQHLKNSNKLQASQNEAVAFLQQQPQWPVQEASDTGKCPMIDLSDA